MSDLAKRGRMRGLPQTENKRKTSTGSEADFKSVKRKASGTLAGDDFSNSFPLDPNAERVNVIIEYFYPQNVRTSTETELFKDIPIATNEKGEIILGSIIEGLKNAGATLLGDNPLSYFSEDIKVWVNCGREPLPKTITLMKDDLASDPKLGQHLRLKCTVTGAAIPETAPSVTARKSSIKDDKKGDKGAGSKAAKRTKERKISEIVEKVFEWRRLHQGGAPGKSGMSLEEAAIVVGISKKSLDDYLSQIRYGKKYGFDFNSHAEDKVGELRRFVKKEREKEAAAGKGGKAGGGGADVKSDDTS